MTKEEYNEWKHHPVSRAFFKFLKDRREDMIGLCSETWLNTGKLDDVERGRILTLFEMSELPFEAIEDFYKAKEDDAAKSPEASADRVHAGAV